MSEWVYGRGKDDLLIEVPTIRFFASEKQKKYAENLRATYINFHRHRFEAIQKDQITGDNLLLEEIACLYSEDAFQLINCLKP